MGPTLPAKRKKARALYHEPGSIEIDDDADVRCTPGLSGSWVAAWVFVEDDETEGRFFLGRMADNAGDNE